MRGGWQASGCGFWSRPFGPCSASRSPVLQSRISGLAPAQAPSSASSSDRPPRFPVMPAYHAAALQAAEAIMGGAQSLPALPSASPASSGRCRLRPGGADPDPNRRGHRRVIWPGFLSQATRRSDQRPYVGARTRDALGNQSPWKRRKTELSQLRLEPGSGTKTELHCAQGVKRPKRAAKNSGTT